MPKITFSHNFLWVNFRTNFTFLLGLCLSIFIFNFNAAAVFALYVPTISASIDQANPQTNGNQVINSTDKTTEIPLNLTVNTNNKTGYTAILNSETNETALVNNDSTNGAKINSISSAGLLGDFSDNTWGVRIGTSANFLPIPKLTSPMNVIQTAGKTNGNETNSLKIGMKLSDNLESGRYANKLIFSILTNNYNRIAIMTEGTDFNTKLKALETSANKIEHFKKSPIPPVVYMNTVTVDDEESDYEIKLWLDPTDKTAYYYAETEKVYLNAYSGQMFYSKPDEQKIKNISEINLSNFDTSKVTNMEGMFAGMSNLSTLNLSNFDTSQVTSMEGMFGNIPSLINLNLSNFNTSKVTNMDSMFVGMHSLTNLDLSNCDTSQVTNMYYMFSDISNLATLNLSSFDTSNVTNMSYMFSYMNNLTTLNISNFNTSKVTDMEGMFTDMFKLTSLSISNFDTSNVTNMSFMFADMTNLISLDISNFNTSKVTNMYGMLSLRDENKLKDKLEKIYVNNDFDTSELTDYSYIFKNRKTLRGGNGSYLADPSTTDKTWLRVDRPGVQGYFTRKP